MESTRTRILAETCCLDEKELAILGFNDQLQMLVSNSNSTEADKSVQFAIWQKETFKPIDRNMIGTAYQMNNQGLILGRKWVQEGNRSVPMLVLYNPLENTVTEIMKDTHIAGLQLNDRGQVIIFQALKTHIPSNEGGQVMAFQPSKEQWIYKGFLWDSNEGLVELENFAPSALNNRDQIVGFQISEMHHNKMVPMLWTPDQVIPLSSFIGLGTLECIWSDVLSLNGINDNGYIIGQGLFDGKKHAFLLIPE